MAIVSHFQFGMLVNDTNATCLKTGVIFRIVQRRSHHTPDQGQQAAGIGSLHAIHLQALLQLKDGSKKRKAWTHKYNFDTMLDSWPISTQIA